MVIVWLTSAPVYADDSDKVNIVREGWIQGALNGLLKNGILDNQINVFYNLFPIRLPEDTFTDCGIRYQGFYGNVSSRKVESKTVRALKDIFRDIHPDIVHIWGTERTYSCAAVRAAKELGIVDKVVVSLQGINCFLGEKVALEIPVKYTFGMSLPELGRLTSLRKLKKIFDKKAKWEKETLTNVSHIIGRTFWDQTAAHQLNPKAQYHFCNETLRTTFYDGTEWNLAECEKYSVFVSQGLTCNKGLHQVLRAMPYILQRFPNAKVYTTGRLGYNNKYGVYAPNSYEKYLLNLMERYNLKDKVVFLGKLTGDEMKQRYLKSHVYICPSSIENESNALSESKILGVPSVIAYVGGMLDRIEHGVDGFVYPYNELNIMAEYVCQIFQNDELSRRISSKARENALRVNDMNANAIRIQDIYKKIIGLSDDGCERPFCGRYQSNQ